MWGYCFPRRQVQSLQEVPRKQACHMARVYKHLEVPEGARTSGGAHPNPSCQGTKWPCLCWTKPLPTWQPPFPSFSSFSRGLCTKTHSYWLEHEFVIFAVSSKPPLFGWGQRHRLPTPPFLGPRSCIVTLRLSHYKDLTERKKGRILRQKHLLATVCLSSPW